MKQATTPATIDTMLKALCHPIRRRTLLEVYQRDSSGSIDVATFAADGHERIALYHTHLPKLAESGFIDWDDSAGTVRRGPNFEEIVPMLDLLIEYADGSPAGR